MFTLTTVIISGIIGLMVGVIFGFIAYRNLEESKVDDIQMKCHIEVEKLKKEIEDFQSGYNK